MIRSQPDVDTCHRAITQVYTPADSDLSRYIFNGAPKDFDLPPARILMPIKTLHELLESGSHWFNTYQRFHTCYLGLKRADHDPCLLFISGLLEHTDVESGLTILQTNETTSICNKAFPNAEYRASERFESKPLHTRKMSKQFKLNGSTITLHTSLIIVDATFENERLFPFFYYPFQKLNF